LLSVLEGTEEAKRIGKRLERLERKWKTKNPDIYHASQELLFSSQLFSSKGSILDNLREKFGVKLGFPRGFIYKIIKKEDIFDVAFYLDNLNSNIRDIMRRTIIFAGIPESEADIKHLWRLPRLPTDLKKINRDLKDKVESK